MIKHPAHRVMFHFVATHTDMFRGTICLRRLAPVPVRLLSSHNQTDQSRQPHVWSHLHDQMSRAAIQRRLAPRTFIPTHCDDVTPRPRAAHAEHMQTTFRPVNTQKLSIFLLTPSHIKSPPTHSPTFHPPIMDLQNTNISDISHETVPVPMQIF